MTTSRLSRKVRFLFWLARIQRVTRVILRSVWIGIAGYLFAWGTNGIWNWFPDASTWISVGLFAAALNLFSLIFRKISFDNFIWNLDRKLGLNEQLSAAMELEQSNENLVGEELIEESLSLVPGLRKRISKNGWRLRGEIQGLIIVVFLLVMVWLSGIGSIPSIFPGGFGFLPGLGSDPNAEGIFPSGHPGLTPGEAEQLGVGNDGGNEQDNSNLPPDELGEVSDVLSDLGKELEDTSSTSEFGKTLQQGDFGEAADELSNLAENIDELSEETKENLQENFQNAADELQKPNQQSLADALREASEALRSGDDLSAGEKFDDLAEQLDRLDSNTSEDQQENETDLGVKESESLESRFFDRIFGEGETFDLSEYGTSPFLQPAGGTEENGDIVIGGDLDLIGPEDGSIGGGLLTPFDLPWEKRDVVSEYFSP